MQPSTVALAVLGVAGAGAGVYFLTRKKAAPAAAAPVIDAGVAAPASSDGGLRGIEDRIGKALGLPVSPSKIGDLAQSAPTALKIAVLPIGAAAVAQTIIEDPRGAAVAVGSGAKAAVSAVGSALFGSTSVKDMKDADLWKYASNFAMRGLGGDPTKWTTKQKHDNAKKLGAYPVGNGYASELLKRYP